MDMVFNVSSEQIDDIVIFHNGLSYLLNKDSKNSIWFVAQWVVESAWMYPVDLSTASDTRAPSSERVDLLVWKRPIAKGIYDCGLDSLV